jgi:flagellar hook-associated protein 2
VNTGIDSNTFRILLSGTTGSNGVFTLTSSPDLGFHDIANSLQTAQDSIINYEGISVTRETNSLTDVIQGVTLNLLGTSASPITVNINSDTSTLKVNVKSMVTTYNDVLTLFNNFTSVEDADVEMSGALSDDTSLIRFLKDKMHAAIFGVSSSPSGSMTALRDIGITVNQYGKMILDETKYDSAVQSSYSDIVTMLTANTSNQNLYDTASKGLAQDVATILGNFTETNGVIKSRETTSTSDKAETEEELVKLEARMDTIYARYLKQFGAMEGLMARLDKTKDYLTSQFETLSKAYDD